MTRKRRRILLFISIVLFMVLVAPVLLYSFGYRFSTETWQIVRAGGFSISSTPSTGTQIYLDGKLAKKTSLLSRRLFIQGLTPRAYKIRIEKDGYFPWEKTLPVYPERVTDIQALLVRDGPEGTVLLHGDWQKFSFLGESRIILKLFDSKNRSSSFSLTDLTLTSNSSASATTTSVLPDEVKKILADKKPIDYDYDSTSERIIWWDKRTLSIRWLKGEEFLPLYTETSEEIIFRASDAIRNASFYPGQDAILLASSNAVMVVELDGRGQRNTYPLYKGREPRFLVSPDDNKVYILDDGNLIAIPLT